MIGAVIGDIIGSIYEWDNIKVKDFELFNDKCSFTDDSVMTIAIADAFLCCKEDKSDLSEMVIKKMQEYGKKYPRRGYGGMFVRWLDDKDPKPYNSFGNGAAMRISSVAYVAKDEEELKKLSKIVTEVTHNHPEGIKGAEATALAIYYAWNNEDKEDIRKYITKYYYSIDYTLDELRKTYKFNETCQETVPQALLCFFESNSYEDCIRNAISIGGDSDTIAAIAGSIAEAYYGIPRDIEAKGLSYLDRHLLNILKEFYAKYIID